MDYFQTPRGGGQPSGASPNQQQQQYHHYNNGMVQQQPQEQQQHYWNNRGGEEYQDAGTDYSGSMKEYDRGYRQQSGPPKQQQQQHPQQQVYYQAQQTGTSNYFPIHSASATEHDFLAQQQHHQYASQPNQQPKEYVHQHIQQHHIPHQTVSAANAATIVQTHTTALNAMHQHHQQQQHHGGQQQQQQPQQQQQVRGNRRNNTQRNGRDGQEKKYQQQRRVNNNQGQQQQHYQQPQVMQQQQHRPQVQQQLNAQQQMLQQHQHQQQHPLAAGMAGAPVMQQQRVVPQQQQQQHVDIAQQQQQQMIAAQLQNQQYLMPLSGPLRDFPVRVVFDAKSSGAIIGHRSKNLQDLNTELNTRIDVEQNGRKPNGGDRVFIIHGNLEQVAKVIAKLLSISQRDTHKDGTPRQIELKLRAHNQLVGRLIGKQGSTIKKIMEDTNTTIVVSSDNHRTENTSNIPSEALALQERTITVKGETIEDVVQAQTSIVAKLRKCYDVDFQARNQTLQNQLMVNNMMPQQPYYQPMAAGDPNMYRQQPPQIPPPNSKLLQVMKVWVPEKSVGSLIGAKGKNIKQIIRDSGASVKIDTTEDKKKREDEQAASSSTKKEERHELLEDGSGDGNTVEEDEGEAIEPKIKLQDANERMVTLTGNDFQVVRVHSMIYHRVWESCAFGQGNHIDPGNFKLRTEVKVPSQIIGRIIGKKGQNVKELQRLTGAIVKIPEEERNMEKSVSPPATGEKSENEAEEGAEERTTVRIIANLPSCQQVIFRLIQLIGNHYHVEREKASKSEEKKQHSPTGLATMGTLGQVAPFNQPPTPK